MKNSPETAGSFTDADVIEEHALALGLLCIYWASLDNALANLLNTYLGSDDVGAAVTAPDTSTRCEQIRKLAHVTGPDGEWRDCLLRILRMIQKELAETRNRYIHDGWTISEAGMVRIDRRPKLQKPQARQPVQLVTESASVVPAEWVQLLTQRVIDTMVAIAFMAIDVRRWRDGESSLKPTPLALDLSTCKPLVEIRPPAPTRWKLPH